MNIKNVTAVFILTVIAVVIAYDIYAISVGGTEASVSSVIINFSYKMPIATFAAGVLCGHLFWRMKENKDTNGAIDKVGNDGNIS